VFGIVHASPNGLVYEPEPGYADVLQSTVEDLREGGDPDVGTYRDLDDASYLRTLPHLLHRLSWAVVFDDEEEAE
jgi:hypothetical protein